MRLFRNVFSESIPASSAAIINISYGLWTVEWQRPLFFSSSFFSFSSSFFFLFLPPSLTLLRARQLVPFSFSFVPFPFDIVIYSLRRLHGHIVYNETQFWRILRKFFWQIRISIPVIRSKIKEICFVGKNSSSSSSFFLPRFFLFFPSISRFLICVLVEASRNSDARNTNSVSRENDPFVASARSHSRDILSHAPDLDFNTSLIIFSKSLFTGYVQIRHSRGRRDWIVFQNEILIEP